MNKQGKLSSRSVLTLGVKVLLGVSFASNLFIGGLLYVNLSSNSKVEDKVNEVIEIRESLSTNLRGAIVELQSEFLKLPDFFQTSVSDTITASINSQFPDAQSEQITGRESYKKLYNREERRDLAKDTFVLQSSDTRIIVSKGVFTDQGEFTDIVRRQIISSNNPDLDIQTLQATISKIKEESSGAAVLTRKVQELGEKVADVGLKAETTRTEILTRIEEITSLEKELASIREYQEKFTINAAVIAIAANMAVLFFLIRWIIEKPLSNLTSTIDEIRSGRSPDIPFRKRKDQIGVLSGAIENFREALSEIRDENARKEQEKLIIDEMFSTITSVVDNLEHQAKDLVDTATSLEGLAKSTENQTESVTKRALETAEHTSDVSNSTVQLQSAFRQINGQITNQNRAVSRILESNTISQENIEGLQNSLRDINGIISMVSEITDQTKLVALNATIEAARAGTEGQGFCVVANEVKDLSLKTEEATNKVMTRVEAIEQAASLLVSNLNIVDERVIELNKLTNTITTAVEEQQKVTTAITDLAGQTSTNTQNVSVSMNEVNRAAAQTRDLASHVHVFSNEIAGQLTKLYKSTTDHLEQLSHRGKVAQL